MEDEVQSDGEETFLDLSMQYWVIFARDNCRTEEDRYFYSNDRPSHPISARNEAAALASLLPRTKEVCGDNEEKLQELEALCSSYVARVGGPTGTSCNATLFPPESPEDLLTRWCCEQGVETNVAAATLDGGLRGMVATQHIPTGGTIMSIPASLLITYETAKTSELGQVLAKIPNLMDDMTALIWTMVERADPESTFAPYWRALPETLFTGLSVSDEEMEVLEGTHLYVEMSSAREMLREQYDSISSVLEALCKAYPTQIRASTLDWASFLWAAQLWYAYAAQLAFPDGAVRTTLLPLAGLLNHSPWPHCVHYSRIDPHTNCLRLPTFRPVAAGEEVTISYGPLPNSKLLLFYGFVVPNNPADTLPLSFEVPEDDMHRDEVLARAGLSSEHTLRKGALPPPLLAALRVVAAQPEELEALAGADRAALTAAFQEPLSPDTEVLALEALTAILESLIDPYEQYIQAHGAPSAAAASDNDEESSAGGSQYHHHVHVFMHGQLEILTCAIEQVRELLDKAEAWAREEQEEQEGEAYGDGGEK